jgi:hypothetical protein
MDDSKIIDLFFERSEKAIVELSNKYGSVCLKVSMNILNNYHEAEEGVNDSYLGVFTIIAMMVVITQPVFILEMTMTLLADINMQVLIPLT